MRLAAIAFDPEAVLADRREMRAARDEGDVRTGLGERRAVDSADPAGPDNRDAHTTRSCALCHPVYGGRIVLSRRRF